MSDGLLFHIAIHLFLVSASLLIFFLAYGGLRK